MNRASSSYRGPPLSGWRAALGALAIAASHALCAAPASVPIVRPDGTPLKSSRGFSFDKDTRRASSGIACVADKTRQRCLVVFDEGRMAQFATLGADSLEPEGTPVALVTSQGELDAEGAATDGEYFYVVGSHSVKRKDCKSNAASRHLVRFKAAWTAPAASSPQGSQPSLTADRLQQTGGLWELMKRDPYLGQHADGCLGAEAGGTREQQQRRPGLDIEGIATKSGRLYLGFRGPTRKGVVPVYSVDASALFDGTAARPQLSMLDVGSGLGIRDMVAGKSALLLLLGPDDHEPVGESKWRVAEWKDGNAQALHIRPRVLAELDLKDIDFGSRCFKELKPEAMAILEETADRYRIVVLSDGVCDGGAVIFNVPR